VNSSVRTTPSLPRIPYLKPGRDGGPRSRVRKCNLSGTGYPIDQPAIARLRGWGAEDAHVADLQAARERLLLRHEGPEEWIEGFRVRFLPPLDEIARRRIRQAATTAGKLTAISPRGAIDAIVVAALAIELVSDLCAINNLKANRVETIQILGRVFLAAGIASQADDWTESASEGTLPAHSPTAASQDTDGFSERAAVSQARAKVQSRYADAREMPSTSPASSTDRPAKTRRAASRAAPGSTSANRSRTSLTESRSSASGGLAERSSGSTPTRRASPPRFAARFFRA
jgi:hypothetical protein